MTESEWLKCNDPREMLDFLRSRMSERKLRLFVCAWERMHSKPLDEWGQKGVEVSERRADGLSGVEEIGALMRASIHDHRCNILLDQPWNHALGIVWEGTADEQKATCSLFRDIFGNPLRSLTIDPRWLEWNGASVVTLAQRIYEARSFGRMPELAGILEAADCTDEAILGHCRGAVPHVRGCWVLDLILGKK